MILWNFDRDGLQASQCISAIKDLIGLLHENQVLFLVGASVPYALLPILKEIHDSVEPGAGADRSNLQHETEELIYKCLFWVFGLKLKGFQDLDEGSGVDPEVPVDGLRPLTRMSELDLIWHLCSTEFASLNSKEIKSCSSFFQSACEVATNHIRDMGKAYCNSLLQRFAIVDPPVLTKSSNSFESPICIEPFMMIEDGQKELSYNHIFCDVFHYKTKVDPSDLPIDPSIPFTEWRDKLPDELTEEWLVERMSAYVLDTMFNNSRIESWFALAESFHKTAEALLFECLGSEDSQVKRSTVCLADRLRRIGHWCCYLASCFATKELEVNDLPNNRIAYLGGIFEKSGLFILDDLSDAPPLYNQWCRRPSSMIKNFKAKLKGALKYFTAATLHIQEMWSPWMLAGRCMKRLGLSPEAYLPVLANSCLLALNEYGGLVDTMYELHSARLELLGSIWNVSKQEVVASVDTAVVESIVSICSMFCFTNTKINTKKITEKVKLLFEDTVEAMDWCIAQDSLYYKARVRCVKCILLGDSLLQAHTHC